MFEKINQTILGVLLKFDFLERMYLGMDFRQSCTARRTRILVGNKIDLERSRQVSNKGETRQILRNEEIEFGHKKYQT